MARSRAQRPPRILNRRATKLLGPLGPLPWASSGGVTQLFMYSFSEVLMCEWVCTDGEDWERKQLVVDMNERACPPFKSGAVQFVQMMAWPCSMSHNGEEDAGWAIDSWEATVERGKKGDVIQIALDLAITGEGTRMNRIGYSWTAYVSQI